MFTGRLFYVLGPLPNQKAEDASRLKILRLAMKQNNDP